MIRLSLLALFLFSSCVSYPVKSGVDDFWYRLYFTSPGETRLKADNPETAMIETISSARESFFGAFYDLSAPEIVRALISAKSRGVDVRLVLDDHFINDPKTHRGSEKSEVYELLKNSDIPVVFDERRGLMHNKFAVIDGLYVWTGSYNLSPNGARVNNNNAIQIRSEKLAAIFLEKFNYMFEDKIFGQKSDPRAFAGLRKLSGRDRYYVKIQDTDINVYFSPENRVERILVNRIQGAEESIHFMAFSFTSENIAEAMIRKNRDGVRVSGIFERRGSNSVYSQFRKMKVEGLNVRTDNSRGAMHHKVIIIDRKIVITGSYNFSKNADKNNDENIIIISNEAIAGEYLKEFAGIK